MKAILGGTGLIGSSLFSGWSVGREETSHGPVIMHSRGGHLFIQRHGDPPRPPHRINHRANIRLLKERGVDEVLAVYSVGSLRRSITPGTVVIPDDFLAPWEVPTFFDEEMRFTIPELDGALAERIFSLARSRGVPAKKGGTYVQTRGPRFETRAEIAMLRRYGHIVGMTMASEATLCLELSIPYVALCSVDNFCNGVTDRPLTVGEVERNAARNRAAIEEIIDAVLFGGER